MSYYVLVFCVVCFLLKLQISESCFSNGVCVTCGGGGPPTCGGGCRGGYSCGQYGCYKARAASSKTVQMTKRREEFSSEDEQFDDLPEDDDIEPEVVIARKSPDEKFMSCCMDRNLPDECLNKCNFASYSREALQAMYFRIDRCPMQAASELQFCAAQGRDHMDCCARSGVGNTLVGAKCLTFCDQRPGNVTNLDFTYLACLDRFEIMKGCFWNDLVQGRGMHEINRFDNLRELGKNK